MMEILANRGVRVRNPASPAPPLGAPAPRQFEEKRRMKAITKRPARNQQRAQHVVATRRPASPDLSRATSAAPIQFTSIAPKWLTGVSPDSVVLRLAIPAIDRQPLSCGRWYQRLFHIPRRRPKD